MHSAERRTTFEREGLGEYGVRGYRAQEPRQAVVALDGGFRDAQRQFLADSFAGLDVQSICQFGNVLLPDHLVANGLLDLLGGYIQT